MLFKGDIFFIVFEPAVFQFSSLVNLGLRVLRLASARKAFDKVRSLAELNELLGERVECESQDDNKCTKLKGPAVRIVSKYLYLSVVR